MSIKIGIDGIALSGQATGIGRYVQELCRCLQSLLHDSTFFVYSHKPLRISLPDNWHQRIDANSPRYMSGYAWLKFRCKRFCEHDGIDVFWASRTLVPRLSANISVVSTVHDLNHLLVPETMPIANRWAHRLWFKSDVMRAKVLLANSAGTRDRVEKLLSRRVDGIVRPGLSAQYRPLLSDCITTVLRAYGISRPYLLGVGTQEPRKNLASLVRAYIELKLVGQLQNFKLVLVGAEGWKNGALRRLINAKASQKILPLGYVPEDDLPMIYAGAEAFVFPSIYEGFGMPVLEARACGTRVITTDIPELREAGGEDAVYTEPTVNGIKKGILEALAKPKPNGQRLAEEYAWEKSAAVLAQALINAAGR